MDGILDAWHSSPLKQHSAGPARGRKQADLKPLVELEVHGFVFEHQDVPHLFFPMRDDLRAACPDHTSPKVKEFIRSLNLAPHGERGAYEPLVALFNYIASHPSQKSTQKIFFIVYDKQMEDLFDGAGYLKPDGLGSETEFSEAQRVPWAAVWIAIEVKNSWPEAMQQALTYARSMLAVGDRWFSLVLVYNHLTKKLRFCFATRQGVFLSPIWNLRTKEFDLAACALLHACHASGTVAGRHEYRFLGGDPKCLHFRIPQVGLLKSHSEIFHRIHIIGRATHAYLVTRTTDIPHSPEVSSSDPAELEAKLVAHDRRGMEPIHITGLFEPPSQSSQPSGPPPPDSKRPASNRRAQSSKQTAPPSQHQLIPTPRSQSVSSSSASASIVDSESWETLCKYGTKPFLPDGGLPTGEFVVKDTWVIYERRNIETEVLCAVRGCYGIVNYAGHMIVPSPGMERLSVLHAADTSSFNSSSDWSAVNRKSGPIFLRRVRKLIFYSTVGYSLEKTRSEGWSPKRAAYAIKDLTAALYILFRRGYLHRDLSMENILALRSPILRDAPSVLRLLKPDFGDEIEPFAGLFKEQHFVLCDFDHAVEWEVPRTYIPVRSGTWAFLPAARMSALVNKVQRWDESPTDELESLIMVVFYDTLDKNITKATPMEKLHHASFLSDAPYHLAATKHMFLGSPSNAENLGALKQTWPLWWRLFEVASKSRLAINDVKKRLRGSTFAEADDDTKTEFKRVCKQTAYDYLRAVQDALDDSDFGK